MQRKIRPLMLFAVVAAAFFACEECEDCFTTDQEPFFTLRFFDSTTYNLLDARLTSLDAQVTLQDSLLRVRRDSLEAGDSTLLEEIENLEELRDTLDSQRNIIREDIQIINRGEFPLQDVQAMNAPGMLELPDEDSITSIEIPLNTQAIMATYFLTIAGRTDTITLGYDTIRVLDDRTLLIEAVNLMLLENTFPNGGRLSPAPSPTRTSNETTLYVYY